MKLWILDIRNKSVMGSEVEIQSLSSCIEQVFDENTSFESFLLIH
jgi:hypothetical protein